MIKGQSGLSKSLVIIIIIAIVIIALLLIVSISRPPVVEEPLVPEMPEESVAPPVDLEVPTVPPIELELIPLDELPPEWLEEFPDLIDEFPEGIPMEMYWELEDIFLFMEEGIEE